MGKKLAREMNLFLRQWDSVRAVLIALFVIMPVFFQMQGGIFRDTAMVYDHGGALGMVPLPVSMAACFIGIALLVRRLKHARIGLVAILGTMILMYMSSLVAAGVPLTYVPSKFILVLQFSLPMFGLALGQMYERIDGNLSVLSKIFCMVLFSVIPLQMLLSWHQDYTILSPHMYWFSIYQHLQYVPFVFTSAFLVVLFHAHHPNDATIRSWSWFFLPVIAVYIIVSASLSAMVLLLTGVFFCMLLYGSRQRETYVRLLCLFILTSILVFAYLNHYRGAHMLDEKFQQVFSKNMQLTEMAGIKKRLGSWQYHYDGATKDVKSFLVGNPQTYERAQYSSAHNYYLDFLYHFGFLSLLPLLILVAATLFGMYRKRREILASPGLCGLVVIILFLLFFDNMLKVTLRQPYPGIFSFFLWGIMLSKLFGSLSKARDA